MSHLAPWKELSFSESEGLTGLSVLGRDRLPLGTVIDALVDHETGQIHSLVIDTTFGRQVLLPFSVFSVEKAKLRAPLTHRVMNQLPVFENKFLVANLWNNYEKLYRSVAEDLFLNFDLPSNRKIRSINQHRSANILERFAEQVRRNLKTLDTNELSTDSGQRAA